MHEHHEHDDHHHDHDHDHEHGLGELAIPSSSRTRRTRMTERTRRIVRETTLEASNLILPIFTAEQSGSFKKEIGSMPGVYQSGLTHTLELCESSLQAGLGGVILFGIPQHKDATGTEAYNENGIVQQTIREIKSRFPELLVITDVCLCEYTDHGHCGIVTTNARGEFVIDNDSTVDLLAQEAITHAYAGADMIAPSDMMDGRIGAIREALDHYGFSDTPVLAYSAKYASGFYGPFREAAESTPTFGDRRSHQMDVGNTDEAMRVMQRDLDEGADILMVKPALPALDIIRRARDKFQVPLAAYQVSGEYSMIKAAAERGWVDEDRIVLETLTSIKRAGASIILSYYSLHAAALLRKQ